MVVPKEPTHDRRGPAGPVRAVLRRLRGGAARDPRRAGPARARPPRARALRLQADRAVDRRRPGAHRRADRRAGEPLDRGGGHRRRGRRARPGSRLRRRAAAPGGRPAHRRAHRGHRGRPRRAGHRHGPAGDVGAEDGAARRLPRRRRRVPSARGDRLRRRAAISRLAAALAAAALAAGLLLTYADHTVLRSDGFADRTAAALERPPVRDAAARRLTDAALALRPNLVAVRPLVELGARTVVGTAAFRSLVRRGALEAHRSAFRANDDAVAFRVRDAGVLVADAVGALRPDAARRVPTGMVTTLARVHGGIDGFLLALAEHADRARRLAAIAFALALVLGVAGVLVTDSRRASAFRLGVAAAGAGGLVALLVWLAPRLLAAGLDAGDRAALTAAAGVWLDPVRRWALAGAAIGACVALAAMAVVRPIPVAAALGRVRAAVARPPRNGRERALRLAAALAAGAGMGAWPRAGLTAIVVISGAALAIVAAAQLLALAAGPAGSASPARPRPSLGRAARVAAAVVAASAVIAGVAIAAGDDATIPRTGRCNGHAALCDRRLDEVALLGTHNSMAAAGEPGWLFAAQDAGIPAQLRAGVRALLIDTHYGVRTPRGVRT